MKGKNNSIKVTIRNMITGEILCEEECRAIFCGLSGERTTSFSGCYNATAMDYVSAACAAEFEISTRAKDNPELRDNNLKGLIKHLMESDRVEVVDESEDEDNE